ncbi:MAG TPA: tetratricopeptide repeat protein, partial [Roseiflexaceae bacterium]|nr:tetratricopeptide repeat protein [Roseiflexaceae bacterium]
PGGAAIGMMLARELEGFWSLRGNWAEARSWLTQVLEHPESLTRTILRARTCMQLADMHAFLNDYATATALYSESLSICEELGDREGLAWLLNRLGWLAREQGDLETARGNLEASLALCRELDDEWGIAGALNTLGAVAVMQEDVAWATRLLDEGLSRYRSLGDGYSSAWALNHLGHVAQLDGNYERSKQLQLDSLELFRKFSDQHLGTAWALHGLGECTLAQGDFAAARQWFVTGLSQFHNLGDHAGASWCMAGLGSAAALDEEPERAVKLLAAAEALRASLGARHAPAARAMRERATAMARATLGDEMFAAAWQAGQALSVEQAIAEALFGST